MELMYELPPVGGHYESDLLKRLHCLNTNKTVP